MHNLEFTVAGATYAQPDIFFDTGSPIVAINNDTANAYWKSVPNAVRINDTNWATPCVAKLPDLHFTSPLNGQYQYVIPGSSFMGKLAYNVPILDIEFPSTLSLLPCPLTSTSRPPTQNTFIPGPLMCDHDRRIGKENCLLLREPSVLRRSYRRVMPIWLCDYGCAILRDPLRSVGFLNTKYHLCIAAGSPVGYCRIAT